MPHRLYTFGNMYLSSIQQGIQGLHVLGEMLVKYPAGSPGYPMFYQWASVDKTLIALNGGYASTLRALHAALEDLALAWPELPFSWFHEESDALDGALTCVGVVIPEEAQGPMSDELAAAVAGHFQGDTLAASRDRRFSPMERLILLRQGFRLAS